MTYSAQDQARRERLAAVLAGARPDRPPISFWRHWPGADQAAGSLARATVEFQRRFDFDFVKLPAPSNYPVAGWGAQSERGDGPIGSRVWTERRVRRPEDWLALQPQEPDGGLQGEVLAAVRLVRAALGAGVPLLLTVFCPLAQARYLAGEATLERHLAEAPEAVLAGLGAIAESTARFVERAGGEGIDGLYFAVQHAGAGGRSAAGYARFGAPFDRRVLAAAGDCWFNLLHLHGSPPLFGPCADYPVGAINWHASETPPTWEEALRLTPRALCGGLDANRLMAGGSPAEIRAAVARMRERVPAERLILSAGCVVPVGTPDANLAAARAAVD